MFIPIEYAYFAALKADKDLNAYAKSKKVAIVTPSNLFSVMQVVEQLWRVERTSKMLEEILKTGADMRVPSKPLCRAYGRRKNRPYRGR